MSSTQSLAVTTYYKAPFLTSHTFNTLVDICQTLFLSLTGALAMQAQTILGKHRFEPV